MPLFYACGCEHPDAGMFDEGMDDAQSSVDDCPECDSYDDCPECGGMSSDDPVARDAAAYVDALLGAELPQVWSPNLTRQVSCEWEATSGVQTALVALSALSRPSAAHEFHGDSTCDGEIVFRRLRLNDRDSAQLYARSLATIAHLHKVGAVEVGMRAGHHVHISARDANGRGMTPSSLVSLYSVFAHCEDLLYRLASAGWSKHRDESSGGGWAKPIPKLDHLPRTARNVGNAIGGEKYQGLNVSNYVQNVRNCRCGAFQYGDWAECTCDDNRATVEWRLFNASVSPRKIRAYIAIAHTITEYAANTDPGDCAHLSENPFTETVQVDEDSLARQLDYLLARPGFTPRDRDDIMWLASISPGMGRLGRDYVPTVSESANVNA